MSPDPAGPCPAAPKHILAIDQAEHIAEFLRILLVEEGYTVTTGNSLTTAIDQMAETDPALIVVDLAVEDDLALFARLETAAGDRQIPVIVMSCDWDLLSQTLESAHVRSHRFLRKPFDLEHPLGMVNDTIGPAQAAPGEGRTGDGEP